MSLVIADALNATKVKDQESEQAAAVFARESRQEGSAGAENTAATAGSSSGSPTPASLPDESFPAD